MACSYSGVTLPAGDYKVTVYTPGGSDNFYQETEEYWGDGAGGNGIVSGPLTLTPLTLLRQARPPSIMAPLPIRIRTTPNFMARIGGLTSR